VEIITGRTHQIRRHFDMIGFPVVGDPRYGEGNKNRTGLKLFATSLAFTCPYQHHPVRVHIDPDHLPSVPP
jgi:tRNA pseudouridine32 synthase/23S rRNA pseudouridine746 synthase